MEKNFKDSKTYYNLQIAYSGESQATNRYYYFSEIAKKQGYEQIADFFLKTSENEREHAKIWFQKLKSLGTTDENLLHAIEGESYEWTEMYPEFEKIAKKEGYTEIAELFHKVAQIEKEHEQRFQRLLSSLQEDLIFHSNSGKVIWICRNCGFIYEGEDAPEICPFCHHAKSFFERKQENY